MELESENSQLNILVPSRIQAALALLNEANEYAHQTNSNEWDFAVELGLLVNLGLNPNDFRWMVRNSLVEHKREVTIESDNGRAFRPNGDLTFPASTCFVLTNRGVLFSRQIEGLVKSNGNSKYTQSDSGPWIEISSNNGLSHSNKTDETSRPSWDAERRILTYKGSVVKYFKWVAENQETILSVFEEEGWPFRIDDPLVPCPEQDSKRRLSDTIKCLNRKQSNALIHFRGDGAGEGVIWERVECNGSKISCHD